MFFAMKRFAIIAGIVLVLILVKIVFIWIKMEVMRSLL